MTQIYVPSSLGLNLDQLNGPVEVCDETGRVLGQFIPAANERRLAYLEYDCPYTQEELDRHYQEAMANPQAGKPLAEFWKAMERAQSSTA